MLHDLLLQQLLFAAILWNLLNDIDLKTKNK